MRAVPEASSPNCLGERDSITVDLGGGKSIEFETGKIGKQASGAVVARAADTIVYSTACAADEAEDIDFTPLKIDYTERFSAVGRTSGAFNRRDGRASEAETLIARLIDRPIRPMLASGWTHDTQLLSWVLAYDGVNQPDALAVCCASAALCLSHVPLVKPIAAVQVGLIDGTYILNPSIAESKLSSLQLMLAGTSDDVLMIEVCEWMRLRIALLPSSLIQSQPLWLRLLPASRHLRSPAPLHPPACCLLHRELRTSSVRRK
jgi:polyribonucleotide nucleotidyltransferase